MIELRTFGGLELYRSGQGATSTIPLQTKRLVLLAYLAASSPHGFRRRDTILGLFWPDLDQEHARGSLRQALHHLRRTLGDGAILTRGESEIGLDGSVVQSDAHRLEAAVQAADAATALSQYRGDFLEGVFVADSSPELDEWMAAERARLRRLAASAAWLASEQPAGPGDVGQFVRRAVQLSGDDERALRRGVGVLERLGDRAGAVALYEEFAGRVARELNVQVSPETQAAIQAVRAMRVPGGGPPPSGVRLSATLPGQSERPDAAPAPAGRPKLPYLVAVGAGMLVTIVAALMGPGRSAERSPAEGLVAVLPFRVSEADPSLAWLHDGIVELLTIRLAGEGGPRIADPAAVLTAWSHQAGAGRSDAGHEAALQVAGRLGAARLIEGSVVGTARWVTLSARLSTGSGSRLVDRATAEGSPDSLPQLVDRLAAQLLGLNAGVEGPRLGSLTSTSLPAIRAFLQGREAFRGGRVAEAVQRFRDATLLDSTFALAGIELSRAAAWASDREAQSLGVHVALAGRDRLAPQDRAVLEVIREDWISAADVFERWNTAVKVYPDRPETWYGLGDMHYHNGPLAGEDSSFQRAAEAFRRGWLLDSAAAGASTLRRLPVAEPMLHLVEMAQMRHDTVEVLRLAAQVLAVDSASDLARTLMWHRALVTGESARRAFWGGIGSARELALLYIVQFITWSGVGTEDLARATAEDTGRLQAHDPGYATFVLTMRALNAGRPGDVPETVEQRREDPHKWLRVRIRQALSWDGDIAAARTAVRQLRRYVDAAPTSGEIALPQLEDICTLGEWRAAHGDYEAAAAASTRLRAARLPKVSPYDSARIVHYVAICSALLEASRAAALALPDARNKVRAADSLARTFIFEVCCAAAVDDANLILAHLWEREGDLPRALAAARRRSCPFDTCPRYLSTSLREEGRLAALSGDTAGAVRAYRHYLALRPNPAPSVKPAVERVRLELAALQGR